MVTIIIEFLNFSCEVNVFQIVFIFCNIFILKISAYIFQDDFICSMNASNIMSDDWATN